VLFSYYSPLSKGESQGDSGGEGRGLVLRGGKEKRGERGTVYVPGRKKGEEGVLTEVGDALLAERKGEGRGRVRGRKRKGEIAVIPWHAGEEKREGERTYT